MRFSFFGIGLEINSLFCLVAQNIHILSGHSIGPLSFILAEYHEPNPCLLGSIHVRVCIRTSFHRARRKINSFLQRMFVPWGSWKEFAQYILFISSTFLYTVSWAKDFQKTSCMFVIFSFSRFLNQCFPMFFSIHLVKREDS